MPPVIVFGAGDRYAMPLAVTMRSICENLRKYSHVSLWVIDGGLTSRNRKRVEASIEGFDYDLHWVLPPESTLEGLPLYAHFTQEVYFRLLIPSLLPVDTERAIYIDADTLVLSDISTIWDMPFKEKALLAVRHGDLRLASPAGLAVWRDAGLNPEAIYFNAGVLSINCRKWRDRGIMLEVLQVLKQYGQRMRWLDQDGLNAVLANDWGAIDDSWNRIVRPERRVSPEEDLDGYGLPLDTNIVHFASAVKPWHFDAVHPSKALFFEYLDRTSWAGWRPTRDYVADAKRVLATLTNKHAYGSVARRIPVLGSLWERLRRGCKSLPEEGRKNS